MKYLALIFVFGLAAATAFQYVLERERDKAISEFTEGMKKVVPSQLTMRIPNTRELDEVQSDTNSDLGEALKESLRQIIDKIKNIVEKGMKVRKEMVDRAVELKERLWELNIIPIDENTKKMIMRLEEKVDYWQKKLLDRILYNKRRSIQHTMEAAEAFNLLQEIIDGILEKIKEKIDADKIREYIKEKSHKIQEIEKVIIEFFNEGEAKKEIIDTIEKLLKRKGKDTRSLKDSWEELKRRLKDFFKEKHMEFKEKYSAFYEWLKDAIHNGLKIDMDKIQALKNIARELIKYSKEVSKEVAIEALDALTPYKEELGEVWEELKRKVKKILHRDY